MLNEELEPSCGDRLSVERRADERTTTVFRPVLIETEEFAGFCLVRNLSPNGMMGKVYTQFAENTPVTVQFNSDLVVAGAIMWSANGQVGIEFGEYIDVPIVLADLAKRVIKGKLNRAPRLQIQCDGELLIEKRTLPIDVQDISQRGIKARAPYVRPGDEVTVCLEGLKPRHAVVRWTQAGTTGINFTHPLGFEELAQWVIWQQTRMSLAARHQLSA